jgi:hypothetical protein
MDCAIIDSALSLRSSLRGWQLAFRARVRARARARI